MNHKSYFIGMSLMACFTLLFAPADTMAQQTTALPGDGAVSQERIPQGGLRFQRQFFLITPAEMADSELQSGVEINSIGFTIAAAQNAATQGNLKVYLQNTSDVVSRLDTAWTTDTVATNFFSADDLIQGAYEWQVQAVCNGDVSPFSPLQAFQTADPSECNRPQNLVVSNIMDTSATFNWSAPYSDGFSGFLVEYSIAGSGNWTSATTTATSFTANGLVSDTIYQWRVSAMCSGDDSPATSASFTTAAPIACDAPGMLANGAITGTTAELSWTAVSDVTYYSVQYRRVGTSAWIPTFAFTNSTTLSGLVEGTTYEWRIRTVCEAGTGAFVSGMPFTTTGTTVCYPPVGLVVDVLTDTSATFSWPAMPGVTSYVIRYRLRNSISWANATGPMTLVHDDDTTIPAAIGPFTVPFSGMGTSTFTYTGNGLYVAWEYTRPSGPLSSNNTALATQRGLSIQGASGQDSLTLVLSLATESDTSDTAHRAILSAVDSRPETRFGSSALRDSVAVAAVYASGHNAIPFGNPTPVSALIKNYSTSSQTYAVTLTVKDQATNAVRFSTVENINVAGQSSAVVTFTGWSPAETGTDSIIVSVPAQGDENVLGNNRNFYIQVVNHYILSYDDGSREVAGAGFGTGEGLILARYTMNGCGRVNAAKVFLNYSAIGHPVFAVVLDDSGAVIGSSAAFIPDSTEVGNYRTFYFPNTPLASDGDYYIGLAQPASSGDGYFPVGVQYETENIRDSAYYRAAIDGTNLVHSPSPGRLMIRAEITPQGPVPVIEGDLSLCGGDTNTLEVGSKSTRYANQVLAFSSQFSNTDFSARKALGTPDVYPGYGGSPNQWVSGTADGQREYLTLGFPQPAPINFIEIYETLNPGAIDTVYVKNPGTGDFEVVYADSALTQPKVSRINRISFPLSSFDVDEVRLAINSPQVAGFSGIDAVGIGQELDSPAFTSYLWSSGQTTQSIDVASPAVYSVSVTNPNGCMESASVEVFTPDPEIPTISVENDEPTTFCQGGSIALVSSQEFGNTWNTGDTTQSITVTSPGEYFVTFDDGTGCGTTTSQSVEVTVIPSPGVTIAGAPAICPGSSTLLDAGAGYAAYAWSNGAATQTISVNIAGSFSVTVTDNNGCEGSAGVTTFIATPPTPSISGDLSFCTGSSTVLDAGAGYSSYAWSNGSTAQMITVNSAGVFSVTVTDANGCSGSSSVTTTLLPAPMPSISGNLTFCDGNSTILDAGSGYVDYLWSTGETTNSIIVTTVDVFSVTVTDINGCTGTASAETSQEGALPETPGPITGPALSLCLLTGLEYSIDPVPNTTHYVWTVPDGVIIVSGQGTTAITVDVTSAFSAGIIVVKASNFCGQSPTFGQQFLTTQGYPEMPDTPSGPTVVECGPTSYVYSIPEVPNATSYEWLLPPGVSVVSGQGTPIIELLFDPSFAGGEICVNAVNSCGVSLCCLSNCLMVECEDPSADNLTTDQNERVESEVPIEEGFSQKPDRRFILYPNPNSGRFTLEGDLSVQGDLELSVFTMLGELVFFDDRGGREKGRVLEQINVPGLPPGTYIVQMRVSETVWRGKVVVGSLSRQ
jgi:hypothetical protein